MRLRVYPKSMLKLEHVDDQYPFEYFDHLRLVARGVVLDEENRVAIHHIYRDDAFCKQRYYETPGGGVDEGESFEEAFCRECQEEIGYKIKIIACLGDVFDAYNKIHRRNHNRFFLARRKEFVGKHFASSGDSFIQETLYVPIEEAIRLYEGQADTLVSGLVKARELPILREAKRLLDQGILQEGE